MTGVFLLFMIYTGTKISGDGRGKKLGFPTINLDVGNSHGCSLQEGVFAGKIFLENKWWSAMIHIGPRPTFESEEFRVEIFVLENFSSEIFDGEKIEFQVLEKIRDIQKFSSQEELVDQIKKDRVKIMNDEL
jgi:riboflavin kinase/FMN adenylyltransferase